MKQETKEALAKYIVNLALFLLMGGLISWLVEGNFWLKFILTIITAGSIAEVPEIQRQIKQLKMLFEISDSQLVRVSEQVDRFAEKESDWDEIAELKQRVESLEEEISDLKR